MRGEGIRLMHTTCEHVPPSTVSSLPASSLLRVIDCFPPRHAAQSGLSAAPRSSLPPSFSPASVIAHIHPTFSLFSLFRAFLSPPCVMSDFGPIDRLFEDQPKEVNTTHNTLTNTQKRRKKGGRKEGRRREQTIDDDEETDTFFEFVTFV